MNKKHISIALVAAFIMVCPISFAQKNSLTNSEVVKMVKAGLPSEVIVESIKSSDANFDLSADALIALKQDGVPDSVLQAMIVRSKPSAASQQPSISQNGLPPDIARNVMLIDGTKQIQLKRTTPSGGRTGGTAMKMLNPFGKVKMLHAFNGNHAQIRTNNASPLFEIWLPADLNPSDAIVLIEFDVKSDRREISIATMRIGVSTGFSKDDVIPTSINELQTESSGGFQQKLYRVNLVRPASSGEYALVVQGSVYYDFGVDRAR